MPKNAICFSFVIAAFALALHDKTGWGWCIFAAIVTHEN